MPKRIVLDREDMQGLIVRGYKEHFFSCFSLLRFGADPQQMAATKQWLGRLQVKDATRERAATYINIAFTYRGLARVGCPPAILSGFSDEFCGGMTAPHRQRIFGDNGANAPENWAWGNKAESVDAVLLVYARTAADLATRYGSLRAEFAGCGVREVRTIDTCRMPHDKEHFGFHDGIANPTIEGLGGRGIATSSPPVKAGEFILGYENDYQRFTARPVVDRVFDPQHLLKDDVEGSGGADFGRNGSYLVFRQLYQNSYGFWSFIDQAARKLPNAMAARGRSWLGAKMIGRWQSGAPVVLAPEYDDAALASEDRFLFRAGDADGLACPIGAHIRRANPRDGFILVNASDSIALSNRHRLLRRGRSYGPALADSMKPEDVLTRGPDGIDRGLCFICLNANISRQFEFVQGSWINDPSFNELHDDVDPLLGQRGRFSASKGQAHAGGTFTIPAQPMRARVQSVPNFITVRGGAYFFLPGLAALRYLVQC
jgi:Dyp-type peroxidase family